MRWIERGIVRANYIDHFELISCRPHAKRNLCCNGKMRMCRFYPSLLSIDSLVVNSTHFAEEARGESGRLKGTEYRESIEWKKILLTSSAYFFSLYQGVAFLSNLFQSEWLIRWSKSRSIFSWAILKRQRRHETTAARAQKQVAAPY